MATVNTVAKEAGYTYVLNQEALLVAPPGDDLLPLVAKKLNLKLPAGTAPSAAARKCRAFEVRKCLLMMSFNVVTRILMRKTYFHWDSSETEEDREFFENKDEMTRALLNPSFEELFPMFAWLGYPQAH